MLGARRGPSHKSTARRPHAHCVGHGAAITPHTGTAIGAGGDSTTARSAPPRSTTSMTGSPPAQKQIGAITVTGSGRTRARERTRRLGRRRGLPDRQLGRYRSWKASSCSRLKLLPRVATPTAGRKSPQKPVEGLPAAKHLKANFQSPLPIRERRTSHRRPLEHIGVVRVPHPFDAARGSRRLL